MKETDRFRDLKLLGRGGMGMVYRAHDTQRNETVALKVVRDDHLKDTKIIRRFEREFKSLAEINHPNVIKTYDIGELEDRSFYSMEYVEGQSIEELLEDGPLEANRAVQLAIDICDGLHAVHGLGMCHRDITPSNIMVTTKGMAKLMDFGLVKPVEETVTQLTETGHIVGTFVYLPPELLLGKHGDFRSDIYQVSVTLYQMLMGKPPFSPEQVLLVARGRPLPDPEPFCGISKGADGRLAAIMQKAMSFNPANRYVSAEAMGVALKNWMAGDFQSELMIQPELEKKSHPYLVLFVLFLLLLLGGNYFWPKGPIEHEVRNIKVESLGSRAVVISWTASWREERPELLVQKANSSVVEGTLGRCTTVAGKDCFLYRAMLTNLAPKCRYGVKIKRPDGSHSLSTEFQTSSRVRFSQSLSSQLNDSGQLKVTLQGNLPFFVECSMKPINIEPRMDEHSIVFHRSWSMTFPLTKPCEQEISISFLSIDGERKKLSTSCSKLIAGQMNKAWHSFLDSHEQRRFHLLFSLDDNRVNPLFHEWAIRQAKEGKKRLGDSFWQEVEKRLSSKARWYKQFQMVVPGLHLLKTKENLANEFSKTLLPLQLVDGAAQWFGLGSNHRWAGLFAQKPYDLRLGLRESRRGDRTVELKWQGEHAVPWTILVDGFHPTAKTFVPPSAGSWCEPQVYKSSLTGLDLKEFKEAELELHFRAVYSGMIPLVEINEAFFATFPPSPKDVQTVQDFLQRTGAHTKMGLMMLNDPFASPEGTKEAIEGMDALMPKEVMVYRHVLPFSCLREKNVNAVLKLFVGPVDEVRPVAITAMRLRLYR